jgi:peptidyl-prolyl cis-trans isomerase D
MLQTLRKSAGSFVIKILFALLVLSFAIWGIGNTFFMKRSSNTVAEIGGSEITVHALDTAFRNELERLHRFNIDAQQARQLGVLDQVLERLIAGTVYDEAARKMGMTVSTAVIQERIRSQFGKNITPEQFQMILRNNGLTEAQFVSEMRTEIRRAEYLGTLTDGLNPPKPLVDHLYDWRNQKRSADIVTIPVDQSTPVPAPTDKQIEAYYKGHAADYTAPEYRAVSYIYLDPKAVAKKITVTDEKLREVYKDKLPRLAIPEKRTVLQMLVPDRAAADKAIDRIHKGEDFITVAKDVAKQDESATRLGTVTKADLPKEIADAVFALAKDKVSEPVKGPFGLQILEVTAIQPGKTPSFEEARPEIAQEAANEQAIDSILSTTNKLEETLGAGASLPDTAKDLGLDYLKIAAVDNEGQGPDDKQVAALPPAPFLKTAFETKEGDVSLLTETNDHGFFVLRVDSVRKPALKPLETVRAEVTDDWKSEQRWKAAREKAQKLVKELNSGGKLPEIAKKMDLNVHETAGFTREGEGASANMPTSLIADLFAGKAVGHAALGDGVGGVNVAQLTAITAAEPDKDKKGVETLTRSLRTGMANDIANQLVQALRERFGVTVNEDTIRANFYRDAGNT